MPVNGAEQVIENIVAFGGGFLKHVNKTMKVAGDTVELTVRKNVSLGDHSLKDLRRLDHPYAKRHGTDGLHLHDPNYQVHKQGGEMVSALFSKVEDAEIAGTTVTASAVVGFDEGRAPHAAYVLFGTSRMIPRDPLEGSLAEVKPNLQKFFRQELKNAVVGFQGRGTNAA